MRRTLRNCAMVLGVAYFALAVWAVYKLNHKGLPHRPVDVLTNWGQGQAPESNWCPSGTIRVETDERLFLECFRGNRNE